jgi:antitoxin component of MazEF toxin-antitoxin module
MKRETDVEREMENENEVQIRIMADDRYTIFKIAKQIQKIFPNSVFTGIQENTMRKEGWKWRGYLIVKVKGD